MSTRATPSIGKAAAILMLASAATSVLGEPTFNIGIGIRETGTSVAIGDNGGGSGSIEWVGAKPEPAPIIPGKPLVADGTWQTVSFAFGTDSVYGFTGNGTLDGTRGTLEHLAFQNTAGVTDKIAFFVDDIVNTVGGVDYTIEDFESYTAIATPTNGAPEAVFRDPSYSGSTDASLATGDTGNVSAESAASGSNSYRLGFQFKTSDANKWIRLTTSNTANRPNPAIDFSPGSILSFKLRAVVTPVPVGWNVDADGSWNDDNNWLGGTPNAVGAIADFGGAAQITAPRTVTIDSTVQVNGVVFKSDQSYIVAAAQGQVLQMRGPAGFDNSISTELGSHTISAPIEAGLRLSLNVSRAEDTLTLSGPIETTNNELVDAVKIGPGKAVVTRLNVNQLTVSAGTLALSNNGGTTDLNALSIAGGAAPTAQLDIGNNFVVVDYGESAVPFNTDPSTSSLVTQRNRIIAGRNGGTWDGNGITSTGLSPAYAVGIAEAAAAGFGSGNNTFGTATVDDTAVLIRVTLKGDTNLSGKVDFDDLLALAQNYDASFVPTSTDFKGWINGDSNYDGKVDFDDLLALAQNYNGTALSAADASAFGKSFASDWALAQSLVPERDSLGLLGGLLMLTRRRRDC